MTVFIRRPIRLSIYSHPCHLTVVRAVVERVCRQLGLPESAAHEIVLAVDEALSNIIRHAYDGAEDKKINIELSPMSDEEHRGLRVQVRDRGRPVELRQLGPRPRAVTQPGGLGLKIMTACMDSVTYEPAKGGGTVLTLVKRVPWERLERCDG